VLTEDGDGNVDVQVYLSEPADGNAVPDVTPTPEPTVVITETEEVTAGEATARATEEAGD